MLFARVANARAYHNQAAAAAFMYVFKCVSLFLIPQLNICVRLKASLGAVGHNRSQSGQGIPLSLYYVGSGAARTKRRR